MEIEAFNYAQMEAFSDRKDREVYYELKRMSNVIFFALDDYFRFGFTEKPLGQIICEDMGLYLHGVPSDADISNVQQIEEYIIARV